MLNITIFLQKHKFSLLLLFRSNSKSKLQTLFFPSQFRLVMAIFDVDFNELLKRK
jgi:hypothetical protein